MKASFRQFFLSIFNLVIPENLLEHQPYDIRLRTYILTGLLLGCMLLSVAAYIVACFITNFGSSAVLIGGGITTAFTVVTYAYALRLFINTGSFAVAGNFYAFSAFVAIYVTAIVSGGYASPIVDLIVLVPVFVFLMAGRASGIVWAVIALFADIILYALFLNGLDFNYNFIPDSLYSTVKIATWTSLYASIILGLFIYDSVNRNLASRLQLERNHFEYQAAHDSLTGLANRATFERRLEETIEYCEINNTKAVLAIIDLDDFKPVNDRYGHITGDEVLKAVASRMKNSVRNTDTCARIGGDEFAVILMDIDDLGFVRKTIEKLVVNIREPIRHKENIAVTCSIGVVVCPDHGRDVDTLSHHADEMMYAAKENKNHFVIRPLA